MNQPKFCWSCGHAVQLGYAFCEACGAELVPSENKQANQAVPSPQNPDPSTQVFSTNAIPSVTASNTMVQPFQAIPGSLFDPQREFYVMHEKYWDWGSGDILDEKGQIIGKMHRVLLSLRARIELKEITGMISAQIHRKIVAIRPTYDLKDASGLLVGRLKKALLNILNPKIWLEDASANTILEARGSFMRYDFLVYNLNGKPVAEIHKMDRWRDFFLGGTIFDFADRYAIRILDKSVDRRLVLGFCIAIDNSMHDHQNDQMRFGPFHVGGPHHGGPFGMGHQGPWHFGPF